MLTDWLNVLDDPHGWQPVAVAVAVAVAVVLGFFFLYRFHLRQRFPYERRRAARRKGETIRAALASDTDPPEPLGSALVLDRSMGGLGLAVTEPVDIGTRVRLRPGPDDSFPWTRLEVRSCSREERYWKLSCRFLELPEWTVLRALR